MANLFKERGNQIYHLIDRYLGIPFVALLGNFRKQNREVPSVVKRIGIMKNVAIGDTVLLEGITRDIRDKWPNAEIVFVVGKTNIEVVKMFSAVDKIIIIPVTKPWAAAQLIQKAGEFDIWIDFAQWNRINAVLSLLAKAKFRVGFYGPKQFRHYAFNSYIEHRNDLHEIDNFRSLVSLIGVRSDSIPHLYFKDEYASFPGFNLDEEYVVFHMFPDGFKSYMKEWPKEYWLELGDFFIRKGLKVVLTGGTANKARAEEFLEDLGKDGLTMNLAGKISIPQLAALLSKAKLVISVNTGPMHLAAAVGAKLIALHGPTSPKRWRPISPQALVLKPENMDCAPCLHLGFEYGCEENNCMKSITPKIVIDNTNKLLAL